MKRVNIRNGLKQRMNEILGTDYGEETIPDITPWSIEAAMIVNLNRIVSAIAADSTSGRPMKGLWMTSAGGALVNISVGLGFTKNGDIIVLEAPISYTANVSIDDTWHMYLKHEMAEVDGDLYPDGKKTGFIGKTGTQNIVYDDKAAASKDKVQTIVTELVEQSAFVTDNPDWVYLGTITTSGGSVTLVTYSDKRGFGIDPDGWYRIPNFRTSGASRVDGSLTVEQIINGDSVLNMPAPSVVSFDGQGHTGTIDTASTPKLVVVNGIITGATA